MAQVKSDKGEIKALYFYAKQRQAYKFLFVKMMQEKYLLISKIRFGGNKGEQNLFVLGFTIYFNGSSTNN